MHDDLQVGKLLGFGKHNNLTIKPLYAVLDDKVALSGNFTLVLADLNDLDHFLKAINGTPSLTIYKKESSNLGLHIFPFEIIIFLEYIMLCIFILYEMLYSYNKIAVKKLNGYSTISIWIEYIKNIIIFQGVSSLIIAFIGCYLFFGEINTNSVYFLVKIVKIYTFELLFSFGIVSVPFLYLKNIKIVDLLKKMRKDESVFIFNIMFKVILSLIILIVLSNSFKSFQMSLAQYSESYGFWEKTKHYYIIPKASHITKEYFFSEEYRAKQKALYTVLNADGGILADFGFHLDIYNDEYKDREAFKRHSTVNPNYLIKNDVYDIKGNKVLVEETENEYTVLVNEKFIPQKKEILEYLQFSKEGDAEKIANQNIKIIWVKDNQSLFSYNFDINIDNGNLIDLSLVRVLTLANGVDSDYDKIIAYQGNPFKILIDKEIDIQEYMVPKLDLLDLSKHVTEVYSLYDTMNADIYNAKKIISFQIMGMVFLIACMILCIHQNIYLFIRNNLKTIFIKTIHGHTFINKFYKYYIYQISSWLVLVSLVIFLSKLKGVETFDRSNVVICTVLIFIIEFLISYICFRIVSKQNTIRVLKGGE